MKPYTIDQDLIAKMKALAESGKTASQIASDLGTSYPTVLKHADRSGFGAQVRANGRSRQHNSNYVDGRGTYRKFKGSCCEKCGSEKNLHAHHKTPASYNSKWQIREGDHSKENIETICASCHLKEHYDHGRKPMRSDGRRFYSHA